jgi:hypothetical protein
VLDQTRIGISSATDPSCASRADSESTPGREPWFVPLRPVTRVRVGRAPSGSMRQQIQAEAADDGASWHAPSKRADVDLGATFFLAARSGVTWQGNCSKGLGNGSGWYTVD